MPDSAPEPLPWPEMPQHDALGGNLGVRGVHRRRFGVRAKRVVRQAGQQLSYEHIECCVTIPVHSEAPAGRGWV